MHRHVGLIATKYRPTNLILKKAYTHYVRWVRAAICWLKHGKIIGPLTVKGAAWEIMIISKTSDQLHLEIAPCTYIRTMNTN